MTGVVAAGRPARLPRDRAPRPAPVHAGRPRRPRRARRRPGGHALHHRRPRRRRATRCATTTSRSGSRTTTRGDRYGFWAAIERETGAFLGWFHLRPLPEDPPDEPELGYRLTGASWGRGFATEGSRALIDEAFESSRARRVHASTMAVNDGSWRVMEKSGHALRRGSFVMEWPVRIQGDEEGDVEYAIDREEWEADRAAETVGLGTTVPVARGPLDDRLRRPRPAPLRGPQLEDQRAERARAPRRPPGPAPGASPSHSAGERHADDGLEQHQDPGPRPADERIAVRNSSDDRPAATMPASSTPATGRGSGAASTSAVALADRPRATTVAADQRHADVDERRRRPRAPTGSRGG